MKLKNKILLAASGLLVLSGAAATTGAFAWFVSNRAVSVSASKWTVKSNTTDLTIAAVSSDVNFKDSTDNAKTADVTNPLTDVSGDGTAFYTPVFTDKGSVKGYSKLDTTTSHATNKKYYYFDITLTFTASGESNLAIFLSSAAFSKAEKAEKDLSPAGRIAFLDSTSKLVGYFAGEGATGQFTDKETKVVSYIGTTSTVTTAGVLAATNDNLGANLVSTGMNSFTAVTDGDVTSEAIPAEKATFTTYGYLGATTGEGKTLTITERVWLEGTDDTCVVGNINGTFNLALNFYGVAVK